FVAKDLFEAGGVPMLMKTLLDNGFTHADCVTATGHGMAENLKLADNAIDVDRGSLEVQLSDVEFEKRRAAWQPRGSAFWSWIFGDMPSRSGRRATASSPGRAGRPRRRAMRISQHILSVALFGFGFGLTAAYALDGTKSPADKTPPVPVVGGVAVAPQGA